YMVSYRDLAVGALHLALVRGKIERKTETLVRVHEPSSLLDLLDAGKGTHSWPVGEALKKIQAAGGGVMVLMNCGQDAAGAPQAEAGKRGVEAAVVRVPGALEIPLALQWMAQSGRFDALVAVGAVIRGDTFHFQIVANESARGVMDVALDFGLPVANAILTLNSESEAKERIDKGAEGVRVAVEMAKLKVTLHEDR